MADTIESSVNGKYLIYKGLPLVREKNIICYGDMRDKYILYMTVESYKKVETQDAKQKVDVPDKIISRIISTDPAQFGPEKIVKSFEKNGLYDSLDFGLIYLERYNKK